MENKGGYEMWPSINRNKINTLFRSVLYIVHMSVHYHDD